MSNPARLLVKYPHLSPVEQGKPDGESRSLGNRSGQDAD
jgi:hypothetical protein